MILFQGVHTAKERTKGPRILISLTNAFSLVSLLFIVSFGAPFRCLARCKTNGGLEEDREAGLEDSWLLRTSKALVVAGIYATNLGFGF